MALDLWFRDDVRRILDSKEQAARRSMQGAELAGYLAALSDMRTEFGIDGPHVTIYDERPEVWQRGL